MYSQQYLEINNTKIACDQKGFLINHNQWNKQVACEIAARESISLTQDHWEVIYLLRNFYCKHELIPIMRILVKLMRESLGANKSSSLYFTNLFHNPTTNTNPHDQQPLKVACKIAGLPPPKSCF